MRPNLSFYHVENYNDGSKTRSTLGIALLDIMERAN